MPSFLATRTTRSWLRNISSARWAIFQTIQGCWGSTRPFWRRLVGSTMRLRTCSRRQSLRTRGTRGCWGGTPNSSQGSERTPQAAASCTRGVTTRTPRASWGCWASPQATYHRATSTRQRPCYGGLSRSTQKTLGLLVCTQTSSTARRATGPRQKSTTSAPSSTAPTMHRYWVITPFFWQRKRRGAAWRRRRSTTGWRWQPTHRMCATLDDTRCF
mmetsp:Transcript_35602/g.83385  ORF Transcript_35602/g.83385 Transcript_35602/m.83385 type:complete len:215 (+) Transcript_35602:246-890(+)